jgi:quercetin dioxygenase-like cupin family protein
MSGVLRLENRHTGEVLELRRFMKDGVECLELKGSLGAGREGPPLHTHYHADETGTVRNGVLTALVGGVRKQARPGGTVVLPKGVPHRWWNEGPEALEFDGTAIPVVDLDRQLQAVFDIVNAGPRGRPSLFYVAHMALRHWHTQAIHVPPRPVQAVLFRAAVIIGTLLGKYRGTEWPGCPARCTGAPPA